MLDNITLAPIDPILGLTEIFKGDARKEKINLTIGVYQDNNGVVPQLESVRLARKFYFEEMPSVPGYLPMDGLAGYNSAVQKLLLGDAYANSDTFPTIQTIGGSGALAIGAMFLKKYFPKSSAYVSDPTWGNHISIFENAGFEVSKYPYYNKETFQVEFEAMKEFLQTLPAQSVVLLHPCCHNPTGADLTQEQWDELIPILKAKNLIPFLDMAYMGLANGMEQDTYAIQSLIKAEMFFLLSNSFSKIFSLYGERVGSLTVHCQTPQIGIAVKSQLKAIVRRIYSSPSAFGAHIVHIILNSSELSTLWKSEVENMRKRINLMRDKLVQSLLEMGETESECGHYSLQRGMFSATGLSKSQIQELRNERGLYLVENGRICMAGLNENNLAAVADAIHSVKLNEVKA